MILGAEVPLQSLLNKTVSRLLTTVEIPQSMKNIKLIAKWWCDGSSGYTQYMFVPKKYERRAEHSDFENENEGNFSHVYIKNTKNKKKLFN